MLKLEKPRRIVDRKYREWVKTKACALAASSVVPCGGPIDAAHISPRNGTKGIGSKVSDHRVLPLCRRHHDYVGSGNPQYEHYFEELIMVFNMQYVPAKEKRERKTVARVQHLLILCECNKVHRMPVSKTQPWYDAADGVFANMSFKYHCPFLKRDLVASFRRRSA